MQTVSGEPKGVKTVLTERGLWPNEVIMSRRRKKNFNFICQDCKNNMSKDTVNCCATTLLSAQPDFQAQREWLSEIVESAGHRVIYYPKYHCELNFIETLWSIIKARLRRHCDYSLLGLQQNIPKIINSIDMPCVRRVSRYAFRYMSGYRKGLTGPLLDYAVKKYKGHRRIPLSVTKKDLSDDHHKLRLDK